MSKEEIKITFPGSIDLIVKVTDGKQEGVATIGFRVGLVPTQEEIIERIRKFEQDGSMPAGFRLMTKREAWDSFCLEELGNTFAMPGGQEFDE